MARNSPYCMASFCFFFCGFWPQFHSLKYAWSSQNLDLTTYLRETVSSRSKSNLLLTQLLPHLFVLIHISFVGFLETFTFSKSALHPYQDPRKSSTQFLSSRFFVGWRGKTPALSSSCCMVSFCPMWCFDRWSTDKNVHVPYRIVQVREQQVCPRRTALARLNPNLWYVPLLPHLFVHHNLPRWLLSDSRTHLTVSRYAVFKSFLLTCARKPQNPQQILCPLIQVMLAAANTTLPKVRRTAKLFSRDDTCELNVCQKRKFTRQRARTTEKKNTERQTRLPPGCSDIPLPQLVVITDGTGLFHTARTSSRLTVWWAYSHTFLPRVFTHRRARHCGSIPQQECCSVLIHDHMWDHFHLSWCHKHDILSCPFVKVLFRWHGLKFKIVCTRWSLTHLCAPSDGWTSLGFSLFSLIILTGLVNIDPGLQRILHFCRFLSSVCRTFVTYDCTERTLQTSTPPTSLRAHRSFVKVSSGVRQPAHEGTKVAWHPSDGPFSSRIFSECRTPCTQTMQWYPPAHPDDGISFV